MYLPCLAIHPSNIPQLLLKVPLSVVCPHYVGRITVCKCCGFDFGKTYGEHGKGFIHVHHIRPLRTLGEGYRIDPVTELVRIPFLPSYITGADKCILCGSQMRFTGLKRGYRLAELILMHEPLARQRVCG